MAVRQALARKSGITFIRVDVGSSSGSRQLAIASIATHEPRGFDSKFVF